MRVKLLVPLLSDIPELGNPKTFDARRVANAVARMAMGHVDLLVNGHLGHEIASPSISALP
jgi:hypothetical protein